MDNIVLSDLILDSNNFNGQAVSVMNGLLLETTSLKRLSMEKCELDDYFGESIKAGLARNLTLTHLNLRNNSLEDNGCGAICEALHTNAVLLMLDLSDNRLRDKSGQHVGQMLAKNKTVE